MTVVNLQNFLICHDLHSQIPLYRTQIHIFLEWKNSQSTLFMFSELQKLNRNVSNTSSHSLYNLFNLARPWEMCFKTQKVLENAKELFLAYQNFWKPSIRSQVSIPWEWACLLLQTVSGYNFSKLKSCPPHWGHCDSFFCCNFPRLSSFQLWTINAIN